MRRGRDRLRSGYHPWTPEDLAAVRERYGQVPVAELAASLGRTVEAIRHAAKRLRVQSSRYWTDAEDVRLREAWGQVRTRDLAREFDRTANAVKIRAAKLGLDAGRYYTPEELDLVRELYPTHTAAQIAERIYGTPRAAKAVYKVSWRLGFTKHPHWPPEVLDRVQALHAEGLTDADIARRMADVFAPGDQGRLQVKHLRHDRLGLPVNALAVAEVLRGNPARQCAAMGIESTGELRALAYRRYAVENGWPEDIRPREVQILNLLAERGPMTRLELASAIGTRTDRINRSGRAILLRDSGRDGSYTASLLKRGLVVNVPRFRSGGSRSQGNRLPGLYVLTPEAIAVLEANLERRSEDHGQPGAGGTDGPVTADQAG